MTHEQIKTRLEDILSLQGEELDYADMVTTMASDLNGLIKDLNCEPKTIEEDEKIKEALDAAVSALYFNDNSDYETALYKVVSAITGRTGLTEEDIEKLFEELNPEQ